MASQTERTLIRILIGVSVLVATVIAALAPASPLPAIALGQAWIYRLEVSLVAFYACLSLITPAFSGLIRGRLPIEISTRGAKFVSEDERSAELDEAALERLERTISDLAQALANTQIETERLNEIVRSDGKQQGVDSNHD